MSGGGATHIAGYLVLNFFFPLPLPCPSVGETSFFPLASYVSEGVLGNIKKNPPFFFLSNAPWCKEKNGTQSQEEDPGED